MILAVNHEQSRLTEYLFINLLQSNHNVINVKLRIPWGHTHPKNRSYIREISVRIAEVHLNMIRNVTLWHWQITTIIRNHFIKQFARPLMRAYCVETRLYFACGAALRASCDRNCIRKRSLSHISHLFK